MPEWNRRRVLRSGLAAAVAASAAGLAPATAAAAPDRGDDTFPHVPGMRGDRRANEFWYAYEQRFAYQLTQEVKDAYTLLDEKSGGIVLDRYRETRADGTYPDGYRAITAPAREAFVVLSRLQLELVDTYYGARPDLLPWAFVRLGDGSLYDPRMPDPNKVHMMNNYPDGSPTASWHYWHAMIRAGVLLDVSADRWARLDPLVGVGWATQSLMRPELDRFNPPAPAHLARRLIRTWTRRDARELDTAFDSFPYPEPPL